MPIPNAPPLYRMPITIHRRLDTAGFDKSTTQFGNRGPIALVHFIAIFEQQRLHTCPRWLHMSIPNASPPGQMPITIHSQLEIAGFGHS